MLCCSEDELVKDDDEVLEEDELLDCSEEELDELLDISDELEVDELSVLLDFSEVLDELTELLDISEGVEVFAPSLHAVKVSTTAVAVTALKIFLIFIAFFLSTNKKVHSRSHAPKNAKLRLLRHNSFSQKRYTKMSKRFLDNYSVVSLFNYSTIPIVCQDFRKKMSAVPQIFIEYHPRFPTIILVQSSCRRWFFVLQ